MKALNRRTLNSRSKIGAFVLSAVAVAAVSFAADGAGSVQPEPRVNLEPVAVVPAAEIPRINDRMEAMGPPAPRAIPRMPAPGGAHRIWPTKDRHRAERGTPGAQVLPPDGTARPAFEEDTFVGPVLGVNFQALPDNNTSIPPDTHGAAGPAHLMTMLNTQVHVQTKAGAAVAGWPVTLAAFWAPTGATGFFDPRVIYDSGSGRWIAVVLSGGAQPNGAPNPSTVHLAINPAANPAAGAWTYFNIPADPGGANDEWADFPDVGCNTKWIAITVNMFSVPRCSLPPFSPCKDNNSLCPPGDFCVPSTFQGTKMWVIERPVPLGGAPGALPAGLHVFPTGFDLAGGVSGFTLRPCLTFGGNATLFLADSALGWFDGPTGRKLLRLSEINGAVAAPVWGPTPGSAYGANGLFIVAAANDFNEAQVGAPQAGAAGLIDTGDSRMLDAVFRNGHVWCTHSGGLPVAPAAPTRTAVFWYELSPGAMPAPIVQSGAIDGGSTVHHFYPSLAVNLVNAMCIGFSRSHAGIFAEAVFTGRTAAMPLGTVNLPLTVLKAGVDTYLKDFTTGTIRWGDYSATVIDPVDDLTIWTLQEYAELDVGPGVDDDRWGTWWGSKSSPDIKDVQPGVDLFETPPGVSNVTISVPAGFFKPGSDPFNGTIALEGDPKFGIPGVDTVVLRKDVAVLPDPPPVSDTIGIRIVALNLKSSQPITVGSSAGCVVDADCQANMGPGWFCSPVTGTCESQWNVKVCLSGLEPQNQGTMTITRENQQGGTFTSSLPVTPQFIFTKKNDPLGTVRVLDDPAVLKDTFTATSFWVFQSNLGTLTWPGGTIINCKGLPVDLPATSNFVAGISKGGVDQRKVLTEEQALLAAHGVLPPNPKTVGVSDNGGVNPDFKTQPLSNGDQVSLPLAKHFTVPTPNWAGVLFQVNVLDPTEMAGASKSPAPGGIPGAPGTAPPGFNVYWDPSAPFSGTSPPISTPVTFGTLSFTAANTSTVNNSDVDAEVWALNIFHVKPGMTSFTVHLQPSDYVYVPPGAVPKPGNPWGCTPVSPCPNPKHDCFTPGGPGCSDAVCCDLVCSLDPFCCDVSWDDLCVSTALDLCGGTGCQTPADCDDANECTFDDCDLAIGQCVNTPVPDGTPCAGGVCTGGVCSGGGHTACPNPKHPCNIPGGPGCSDAACCNLVCDVLPHCCDVQWDAGCAAIAPDLCPPPSPSAGPQPVGCVLPPIGEGVWMHLDFTTWFHIPPGFSSAYFAASVAHGNIGVEHAATPPGGCQPFFNKNDFDAFNSLEGKFLKGIETFEESNVPDAGKQPLPAPLVGGVPNVDPFNGIGFPNGLEQMNIIIQDNITPGPNPPTVNPSGSPTALFVVGPGSNGANSKKVGEDLFLDGVPASLDLIFTEPNHTGVGFELSRFPGFGTAGWQITVYNKNDAVIGKFQVPPPAGPEPNKSFFGIWCNETIGRINIFDKAGVEPDAIDNIQMWVEMPMIPAVSTWGVVIMTVLLISAGTIVFGRRRTAVKTE